MTYGIIGHAPVKGQNMANEQINEIVELINPLRSLTTKEITEVNQKAEEAVLAEMGEAPHRDVYLERAGDAPKEETYLKNIKWSNFAESMDYALPILWFFIMVVSFVHMMQFSGELSRETYAHLSANSVGILITEGLYALSHQVGLYMMAELTILIFWTYHRKTNKKMSWFGFAAGLCTAVVFYANVSALFQYTTAPVIGFFIGALVPFLNLLIGERLSYLLQERESRRAEQRESFQNDLDEWNVARMEALQEYRNDLQQYNEWLKAPHTHPDFRKHQIREIVSKYQRLSIGRDFDHWNPYVERVLASRELSRMKSFGDVDDILDFFTKDGQQSDLVPSSTPSSTIWAGDVKRQLSPTQFKNLYQNEFVSENPKSEKNNQDQKLGVIPQAFQQMKGNPPKKD